MSVGLTLVGDIGDKIGGRESSIIYWEACDSSLQLIESE
jgi:hypothetical protein